MLLRREEEQMTLTDVMTMMGDEILDEIEMERVDVGVVVVEEEENGRAGETDNVEGPIVLRKWRCPFLNFTSCAIWPRPLNSARH